MDLIELFMEIGKMKSSKRTGWLAEGIENPESVADHSYRMAYIALILGSQRDDIDTNKAVAMALVHDVPESQTGDILVDWKIKFHTKEEMERTKNKNHGITQEEKFDLERKAMEKLSGNNKEMMHLWLEFEAQETREAVFVKSIDKFEMLLQVYEYEKSHGKDLSHWINDKRNHPKDPQLVGLFQQVLKMR